MSNTEHEPTHEEKIAFMYKLAEVSASLLVECPVGMTQFEPDLETGLEVSRDLYIAAVQMKNCMSDLFGTMADSLIWNDDRKPRVLVGDDGRIDHAVMKALSFRFALPMDFPEFSVPLGEQLKKLAVSKSLSTKSWLLVDGEGKTVYFQAIGEKPPMRVRSSRTRATVLRLTDD